MKVLLMIFQLIPAIITAIRSFEDVVPVTGAGKAKLDAVTGIAEIVYENTGELQKDMPKEKLISILIGIVGKIVGLFNATGVFKKGV